MLLASGSLSDLEANLRLCSQFEGCYTTLGIHPCHAGQCQGDPKEYFEKMKRSMESAIRHVVAIGECGLDFDRLEYCGKEHQLEVFPHHFDLAEQFGLPMYLHSRNCEKDFIAMLKANRARIPGGVVHSFTGTKAELREILAMDLYVGVNGCSLKTKENVEVVKEIPLDRLMVETDAPYCSIRASHAGRQYVKTPPPKEKAREKAGLDFLVKGRNEPCRILEVIEAVAAIKDIDQSELIKITYANACKLLKIET